MSTSKPHPPALAGILSNPDLTQSPFDRCLAVHTALSADPTYTGFDALILSHTVLLSASAATQSTVYSFTVVPALCNKAGNLHGGAAATVLDNLTSSALLTIARPGFLDAGHVSRTLTVTYLRPVPPGVYRVESEVVSAGRSLAHVRGRIVDAQGKTCVSCTHDKHVFTREAKL
jgi:acyl-coenzyme A thioesterase 13